MGQNVSTAVMQRRVEPHDSLDDFPTQPWATRALLKYVLPYSFTHRSAWEPACNRGYMAKPLAEFFNEVYCSDIHDYGWDGQHSVEDFLFTEKSVDWIITNPPFKLAERFIEHGLKQARQGVAVIVRSSFLEGVGRYQNLYSRTPPSIVAQFVERVPMVKGRVDKKISTATSYSWLVFEKGVSKRYPDFRWIPPCRKKLEREGDYA